MDPLSCTPRAHKEKNMKMKNLIISLVFLGLLASPLCYSNSHGDPDLNNLIKKCKEFASNPQIKPFKTNVFCRGKRTFWKIKTPDAFELDTEFAVYNRAEMKDNKHNLPEAQYNMPSSPSWLNCRIYSEMMIVIPSVVTVFSSCDELEQMAKLGRDKFCHKILEGMGDEDDAIPTGNTYSTCPEDTGSGPISNLGAEFKNVPVGKWFQGRQNETISGQRRCVRRIPGKEDQPRQERFPPVVLLEDIHFVMRAQLSILIRLDEDHIHPVTIGHVPHGKSQRQGRRPQV